MNTIAQLQAEVNLATTQAMSNAKEAAQLNVLTAQLALVNSEVFQLALINEAKQTAKLQAMGKYINQCKEVVIMNPVRDTVRRTDKKWNGTPTFGLGKDVELLHTLCTGILYSVEQHKEIMVAITKVNLDTVERFLNALGRTSYYSQRFGCIVDEVPHQVKEAKQTAMLLATQLGLVLDTNLLTDATFEARGASARLKANEAEKEIVNTPQAISFTME